MMTSAPDDSHDARAVTRLALAGDLGMRELEDLRRRLSELPGDGPAVIDLAAVGRLDTGAAMLVQDACARRAATGAETRLEGVSAAHRRLLDLVDRAVPLGPDAAPPPRRPLDGVAEIGAAVAGFGRTGGSLLGYLGLFLARVGHAIRHPRAFHFTALIAQADQAGLRAVPIVVLISFLIGIVIGYQGAIQLRQFGAEIFAVDLIAISVLRELGILLTAIIVAGRTASAYTAAIGSMKMSEEIDAMETLGIDPIQALIVPRILALVITLPILGLIADVSGIIGGAVMSWAALDISPTMFATRLVEEISVTHAMVGLVKAPVFAVLIGLIGCAAGMQVKGDAASLGMKTSSAVVSAIFAVIVADAAFSIFFAMMDV